MTELLDGGEEENAEVPAAEPRRRVTRKKTGGARKKVGGNKRAAAKKTTRKTSAAKKSTTRPTVRDAPRPSKVYQHGFFTAVISGPLVMPTEWLEALVGMTSHASINALNAQVGGALSAYNEIASELHERPDDFIEHVASLCAEGTRGEAMVDWYHGYLAAIALRPAEWKALIDDPATGDLFAPFSALQDIVNSPSKREWLANKELRGNLARALGILSVRVWELWRERLFPH